MTTNYLLVKGSADKIEAMTLEAPMAVRDIYALSKSAPSGTGEVNFIACSLAAHGWVPVDSRVYSASDHNVSAERKQEVQEKTFKLIQESNFREVFDYLTSDSMIGSTFITDIVMTRGGERVSIGDHGNIDVDSDFSLMVIIDVVAAANAYSKFPR